MFPLRCTVRNCTRRLRRDDTCLACSQGHRFDRAREGYWSLLQPQDRKSKNPGDSEEAVLARQRWLGRGYGKGLIEALKPWVLNLKTSLGEDSFRVLDLGCGEGSFGPALFPDDSEGYCGVDLSKRAIKMAARGWPDATWVLANADRGLPADDGGVDCVMTLFGRRPAAEMRRVLSDRGRCLVAVPGEEDLIQLRERAQQSGHRRSRWEAVIDEMGEAGLRLVDKIHWQQDVTLRPDAIRDALAMTYRAVRHSQQARLDLLSEMNATLAADLMLFETERPAEPLR